jgi:hypothetical protein
MPFRNIIRNPPNILFHSELLSCSHYLWSDKLQQQAPAPADPVILITEPHAGHSEQMTPPNQRIIQNQISDPGSESPNKNYAKME